MASSSPYGTVYVPVDNYYADEEAKRLHNVEMIDDDTASPFSQFSPFTKEGMASQQRWEIAGDDLQILHLSDIAPGEEIITEVQSTMYLSPDMVTEVECALFGDAADRVCSGENCIKVRQRNESNSSGYLGLTANFPAKIIPVVYRDPNELSTTTMTSTFIAKPGAIMSYLGGDDGVSIRCDPDLNPGRVCCSGLGCCRQRIDLKQEGATAFLAAGGTIMSKYLREGETVTVGHRNILAFADTVTLDTRCFGGAGCFCFAVCGGEGCALPTLTGPGMVLLQSMSNDKFMMSVAPTRATMEGRGNDTDGDNDISSGSDLSFDVDW